MFVFGGEDFGGVVFWGCNFGGVFVGDDFSWGHIVSVILCDENVYFVVEIGGCENRCFWGGIDFVCESGFFNDDVVF